MNKKLERRKERGKESWYLLYIGVNVRQVQCSMLAVSLAL